MRFRVRGSDLEYNLKDICDRFELEVIQESTIGETKLSLKDSLELEYFLHSKNNGGRTSYYDLPYLTSNPREALANYLEEYSTNPELTTWDIIDKILTIFPTTLNDLIEYKRMYPFQHEIFKACYALQERASKDIKGGSILRELNKMKYYIERGIALAKEGKI
jgi:hypothetical protein